MPERNPAKNPVFPYGSAFFRKNSLIFFKKVFLKPDFCLRKRPDNGKIAKKRAVSRRASGSPENPADIYDKEKDLINGKMRRTFNILRILPDGFSLLLTKQVQHLQGYYIIFGPFVKKNFSLWKFYRFAGHRFRPFSRRGGRCFRGR